MKLHFLSYYFGIGSYIKSKWAAYVLSKLVLHLKLFNLFLFYVHWNTLLNYTLGFRALTLQEGRLD